jgi:hypothetical protein
VSSIAIDEATFCANPSCTRIPAPGSEFCYGCRRTYTRRINAQHEATAKLYAVEGASLVKIGITAGEITRRMFALQTGSPVRLKLLGFVDCSPALESAVHGVLRTFNSHGEWFKREGRALEVESMIVQKDVAGLYRIVGWRLQ